MADLITIRVEWTHIRQAERSAADGDRSLTSFSLALVEQTPYRSGRLTRASIDLLDRAGQAVRCKPHAWLGDYLAAWHAGKNLEPAQFTLEIWT